jgi:large subunit ribosomal protein L25
MAQITLNATERKVAGKQNDKLRKAGKLPAVLYGYNVKPQNLEINEREFFKVLKQAGENTILSLNVDGKTVPVLIHEVQNHYLRDNPIHVDFYAVNMTEKIKVNIPVHFTGEAPAVKALGGTLVKNLSEIEVECLPADLPHAIEIDIAALKTFEDAIRVADITVGDKVEVLTNPDEVIVTTEAPRSEEEMKALEEKPVEADVTKVEGVVKPADSAEAAGPDAEAAAKKEDKKE